MRLYADASVKAGIVRALRVRGVDVQYGLEIEPGAPDDAVLAAARAADLVLLTEDTDFGELVFREKLPAVGVILIRLNVTNAAEIDVLAQRIVAVLDEAAGAFVTLSARRKRVRAIER